MAKIAEIIKYEGDNSTFIWKHPCEDFNSTTQLIVHESQEAIFFLNGQALDLFGPSRHGRESRRTGVTKDKTGIFEQRSWHKSTYDSLYIIAQIFCKANKLPCLCYHISIADR